MTAKNMKYSALFSIHLFMITFYLVHFQITSSLLWHVFGLFINIILGIMLLRSVLDKSILYYSALLLLLVYMFIFLGSQISLLHHFSITIVSYFPALTLYFIVLFLYGNHTKLTNSFLFIQFLISFIRDFLSYLNEPFNQFSNFFFFLGILTFYLFSSYLYTKESSKHSILAVHQKKQLFFGVVASFLPFILFSLIPSVFTSQGGLENYWTLIFFLVLPLVVASILTEEKLIYQQYWKTSLIQNFLVISFALSLLVLTIGYLFSFSLMDMILLGYFLFSFFLTSFVILQIYNERKKAKIIDQLLTFPVEKQFLTQQLLRTEYIDSIKTFLFTTLSHNINLSSLEIVTTNDTIETGVKSTALSLKSLQNVLKEMKQTQEEISTLKIDELHYFVMKVDNDDLFLILIKEEEFLNDEILFIHELYPMIHSLLLSARNISNHAFDMNHKFYTPFEKSVFSKEVDLSEKYQSFIAHYLHDEVLQSVLSIRQSVYQKDNPQAIRDSIEHAVEDIEASIRRKMIEWEPSNIPNQSLKSSIGELVQKLVVMYDKAIFVHMDIPDSIDLPVTFQQFIFRSIRELLINAYKHSQAENIKVSLKIISSTIHLEVEDDGDGPFETIDFQNNESNYFGLYSIYQHTHSFNGSMLLSESKTGGLAVQMQFPLETIMKGLD